MDGPRFDRLAKTLAAGASRRRVVRGLVGTALAGLVGAAAADETAARRRRGVCQGKATLCSDSTPFKCKQSNPACICAKVLGGG